MRKKKIRKQSLQFLLISFSVFIILVLLLILFHYTPLFEKSFPGFPIQELWLIATVVFSVVMVYAFYSHQRHYAKGVTLIEEFLESSVINRVAVILLFFSQFYLVFGMLLKYVGVTNFVDFELRDQTILLVLAFIGAYLFIITAAKEERIAERRKWLR